MRQWVLGVGLLIGLSGCAHWTEFLARGPASRVTPSASATSFNFEWELSGDPSVAPVQVFDDGDRTWLQFQPNQVLPAIFEHTPAGEVLMSYRRHLDYVVLDRVVPALLFQGGSVKAYAQRVQSVTPPVALDEDVALVADAAGEGAPAMAIPGLDDLVVSPPAPIFVVQPSDGTLRHTISRWAKQADWTFGPEHWAVDVDIPISARAEFAGSFVEAVQYLLASTELADRPLQPCFYTNQVVRVVPYAQACQRGTAVVAGMAP